MKNSVHDEPHHPVPQSAQTGLSSVDNALQLLHLIGERRALRVADAADELAVARSTAHRLLTTLRRHGFVTQDKPNGVYRPGRALLEIGLAAIGRVDIRHAARPVLEKLSEDTQETVSLLLLEGDCVRFIDCVEGSRSVRVATRTGIVLPAHCTAGGKAILAALPASDLGRRYPTRQLDTRTPNSISTWGELTSELDEIRDSGFAVNFGEGESSICAVGMAVYDLIGYPLAAIAVAVPSSRLENLEQAREIAPLLVRAQESVRDALNETD
ncbi:IclR family transcriptional regulator [Streptomyces sp. NBC_01498]|uniref:IclR family transcriptional regulator n=1 Tax=Streptomyces sp. NBC_01498 TaxID=2975870 RepID=UPI002E7B5F61|nr:IclR family transcriptional regulator [Streptomyces sp. NBC_01498]WTL27995.1 IclR family transcriptional regulator [Streptomyces sp. NBC_01498]